jgi:diguanylate cyclase (GGDEF)-like protein
MWRLAAACTAGLSVAVAAAASVLTGVLLEMAGLQLATPVQVMAVCAAMVLILGPVVLGPLVTLALRQRALAVRLRRVALTDSLTGLPNRRAFFATARRWLRRGGRDFGVLRIDLDRFKAINDRWGHEAGDMALGHAAAVMAAALARAAPGGSLLARLVGEEFAVLLAGADDAGLSRAAEAICHSLRTTPFPRDGEGFPLTASVGAWRGRAEEVDGPLAAADRAVYRAKAAGRDRWEVASDDGPPAQRPRLRRWARR